MSQRLGIRYPIIQGPFGGGLSSIELVREVAKAGGLGSFGAHHLSPDEITNLVANLKREVDGPFAVNLWISTHDVPESAMTRTDFDAHVSALGPVYDLAGVRAPGYPERFAWTFDEQFDALLAASPPVVSFVFGVPSRELLQAVADRGIATIATATTPDEALALDAAGVDVIVASGFEAGGHRGAFLRPAEESLVGTMVLTRVAAEEVTTPIVAAGGIVDARGVAAAFALGAEGVQIGTAFLATDESGTTPEHRALLRDPAQRRTVLTRSFSGRLARGLPNRLTEELVGADAIAPYPYQGYLLRPVLTGARAGGTTDVVSLWAGQGVPLIRHTSARSLMAAIVDGVDQLAADPVSLAVA